MILNLNGGRSKSWKLEGLPVGGTFDESERSCDTNLKASEGWQWCWWHRYVGDFMMVTDFRCWWQNHYVGDFFRYVGDSSNLLNRSPTSQSCHQHIWSPTSVTNINVTLRKWRFTIWTIYLTIRKNVSELDHGLFSLTVRLVSTRFLPHSLDLHFYLHRCTFPNSATYDFINHVKYFFMVFWIPY